MRCAVALPLIMAACTPPGATEEVALPLGGVPPTCPTSIFGSSAPMDFRPDTLAVEVGVKLRTRGTAAIAGVRFYKGPANTGTHAGRLWSEAGDLLASATFTGETATGWQEVLFATPVRVALDTTFVASVHMPNGGFAGDLQAMNQRHGDPDGPVYSLASSETPGGNGVYRYGAGGFPTDTYFAANYWVDVVAVDLDPPAAPEGLTAPEVTATRVRLAWTTPAIDRAGSISAPVVRQIVLRDGVPIAALSRTALEYTDVLVQADTPYTYAVRGEDHCAGAGATATVQVRTLPGPGGTAGETLFGELPPAGAVTHTDTTPVEIAVKLRAAVGGEITAVRFYREAPADAATTVSLWSENGVRLATAPWGGGTVPGWQEVALASPVAVVANTTYIASYHSPNGRFTYTYQGLATPVASGNLTTAAGGSAYVYSPVPRFPSQSFASTNYWVDVRFGATSVPPATINLFGLAPPMASAGDNTRPVIVGVKLRSSAAAVVQAIRAFRPVADPVLAVNLFTAAGVRLGGSLPGADAGGAPGWREVRLAEPVPIAADTTYVASAAIGGTSFSYTIGGLASEVVNGTLRAIPSGVYVYSNDPAAFPAQSYLDSNYWVDVSVSASMPPAPVQTLFGSADPSDASSNPSGDPAVLGVKWRSAVAGQVRAIRFYRTAGTAACCAVALWTPDGTLIASAPSPSSATPGWHEVAFASPVPVNAGWVYVASYHATDGAFTYELGAMAGGVNSGDLRALSNAEAPGNGVYEYSATHVLPARPWFAVNYYVDVAFVAAP